MRLVEIRLLEGPNVYRLEPVVKLEVAIGRRRTWFGQRDPGRYAIVHLGASVPARDWPDGIVAVAGWIRRLRAEHGEGRAGLAVHRSSDPGHWIVTFPWLGEERARTITEAALAIAERNVSSSKTARWTGSQERLVERWTERIAAARTSPPTWIRDADRRIPIVSISGTNGKSTVTRLITHILVVAGRHVGTTTSDGVLVDERMVDAGDWTGPGGAHMVLARGDVDVAVLETARGGIVLRGMGYESNDAAILTNVSSDHLDLQGIHTLPELAEVKSTVARITKPDGVVVLNGDDAAGRRGLAAASAPGSPTSAWRVRTAPRSSVATWPPAGSRISSATAGCARSRARPAGASPRSPGCPSPSAGWPATTWPTSWPRPAGRAAWARRIEQVRDGLMDFRPSTDRSPGRLNLFRLGQRLVIVDFAHNEAGISAVLDVAEGLAGGAAGRAAPITAIIGTAGDRPDDTLRGIGRIAAQRAQRIAIKETRDYLRGRTAEVVVGELLAGRQGRRRGGRRCGRL